jgi:hypothetical protein
MSRLDFATDEIHRTLYRRFSCSHARLRVSVAVDAQASRRARFARSRRPPGGSPDISGCMAANELSRQTRSLQTSIAQYRATRLPRADVTVSLLLVAMTNGRSSARLSLQ